MKERKDLTPQELYEILKDTVIGQDDYLKKVATTVWMHHKSCELWEKRHQYKDLEFYKSNLLCVGPTGSGKTLAVKTLARIYDMNVLVTDMSTYTGAGWKGRDVSEMIQDLYVECGGNLEKTERGIIIMDEIDKALLQNNDEQYASFTVEHSILKLVEGTEVEVAGRRIDTTNILFIAAGAFEGIEDIIRRRVQKKRKLGFLQDYDSPYSDDTDFLSMLERRDLVEYGAGVQFLGRFAELAVLRKLTVDDMEEILMNSKTSVIRSNDDMLKYSCGIRVSMDRDGARAVANEALKEGTGARGLAQIIQPVINDAVFLIHASGEEGETVNELKLTARDGEPWVEFLEGERWHQKEGTETAEIDVPKKKYSFPKPERSHVEQFCWHLLSYYLKENRLSYEPMKAVHDLLCSMIFYLMEECRQDDWALASVKKLLRVPDVYEVLIDDARQRDSTGKASFYYDRFKAYIQFRPKATYRCLEEALYAFEKQACILRTEKKWRKV